jgi:hypothetical protein
MVIALAQVMQNKLSPKTIALGAAGLLALLGCFLPFVGGMSLSKISDMGGRNSPSLPMFLIPAVGMLAVAGTAFAVTKRMVRWQGIVGLLMGLFLWVDTSGAMVWGKFKATGFITLLTDGDIGAKMMSVGLVVAIVVSIVAIANPDPK